MENIFMQPFIFAVSVTMITQDVPSKPNLKNVTYIKTTDGASSKGKVLRSNRRTSFRVVNQ